ncbi:MAG TPA: hypothetical protein VM533_06850 [Fimbriiglobus sp.]|jgi:hypothetical protein|nr:hypothetical protein [Fimbriiglobus sp.]
MSELPPRQEVLDALRYAVAPAAGAAAAVFGGVSLLAWLTSRKFSCDWRKTVPPAAALSVAAALAAGNYAMGTDAPFPWVPAGKPWHWAWWAFGLAVAVELIARFPGVGVGVGHLLRGTAAGVIAGFVVPAAIAPAPGASSAVHADADAQDVLAAQEQLRWMIPAFALAVAVQWAVVDAVGRRAPGGSTAAAVAVAANGAAAVLLHAESLGFLNAATFLFAGLAAAAVLAWLTGTDAGAAAAVATVPLSVLLLLGRSLRDSQVPDSSFLLVGFAPMLLGLFLLPGPNRITTWRLGTVLKVLVVLIPVAVAVYRTMEAAPYSFGPKEEEW